MQFVVDFIDSLNFEVQLHSGSVNYFLPQRLLADMLGM